MNFLASLVVLMFASFCLGQSNNFNSGKNWSLNKMEFMFGAGATQFLGDLGGRDQRGTDLSLVDLDWKATSWNSIAGFRYRFAPHWATSTTLNVGMVRGDDAFTEDIYRKARNLHFRSIIIDFAQRAEYIVIANEKVGSRYRVKGRKKMKNHNEQVYVFAGLGVAYFNAKAKYDGKWTSLRPLRTEGQGLVNGPKRYLPVTLTMPIGVGMKIGINAVWRAGLEVSYVKTFSDYIDDVNGVYYDPQGLIDNVGSVSADLANPSVSNPEWFVPGAQRGGAGNDAYFYTNLVISRNITNGKGYTRSGRKNKWSRRYKF